MEFDFTTVTEVPGNLIRPEALAMLEARYAYAALLCRGRDVLEVACGAGMGLGCLAVNARSVVGADFSPSLLDVARRQYRGRVPLVRLDATALPFRDRSFDAIILYEAVYYLPSPEQFVAEAGRILREGGLVVVCSTNKEWADFNPSPASTRYYSAHELRHLLEHGGFRVELFAGFPGDHDTLRRRAVSLTRRAAVALRLVPKTMGGKEWLKRLFYGPLSEVPRELDVTRRDDLPFVPVSAAVAVARFQVLYAVGHRMAPASDRNSSSVTL